jgi:hypothetical protein
MMNRRLLLSVFFVLWAAVIAVKPRPTQACLSCSGAGGPSDDECIQTWTGATSCEIKTRCVLLYCFTVCRQSDYMCVVRGGGDGPPPI